MNIGISIPIYNQPALLRSCLCSLTTQGIEDLKIYLFDDASNCDYRGVVQDFSESQITYYRNQQNLGALNNMQYAFAQTAPLHEYLMIMHEDDLLAPGLLADIDRELKRTRNKPKLILSYFLEFNSEQDLPQQVSINQNCTQFTWCSKQELTYQFLKLKPLAFGSAIYDTNTYQAMQLDIDRFAEFADRPFLLSQLDNDDLVLLVESPMYWYRSHGANDTRWKKLEKRHVYALLRYYRKILASSNFLNGKEFRKWTTLFIFESYRNLQLSKHAPNWLDYLIGANCYRLLSIKYAFLKISFINRFFTRMKQCLLLHL